MLLSHSAVLSALALATRAPPAAVRLDASAATAVGGTSCAVLLLDLFDGVVDPDAVAAACSVDVEYDDLAAGSPAVGPAAVRALLASKFPPGSRLAVERVADGVSSGGFTWTRESLVQPREGGGGGGGGGSGGTRGLRGTLYAEVDDAGRIVYVREGCEPILKPGEATEALLRAATASMDRPERPTPTFTQRTPRGASDVATYLWREAYAGGAPPAEALRLFADDIVYEDFNYDKPFVGKPSVQEFVEAFDIPGISFVPLRISEGDRACCFTWKVEVNGQDGPQGISFYEVNDAGAVCFVRDIPAPSPRGFRPLGALATRLDPTLRVLSGRAALAAALGLGSAGMAMLRPLFAAQATWQAEQLADAATRDAAAAEVAAEIGSAPVVVYTYSLSPFSSEAKAALDRTGCQYTNIELGAEWFLLDGKGSAKRAALLAATGQSSLPHCFVAGESIGGMYSGAPGTERTNDSPGIAALERSGDLARRCREAGA